MGDISVIVVSHATAMWGAELRLLDTAGRLQRQGVEVSLAAPVDGAFATTWRDAGRSFLPLELAPHRGLRRPDGSGRRPTLAALAHEATVVTGSARRIATLARRFQILHSHSLSANVETVMAGRWARRPVVLDVHDIVRPGLGRRVLSLTSRLATTTIANSTATARTISDPIRPDIVVIHPGVDLETFYPGPTDPAVRATLSRDPSQPLVGIVGRVDLEKGIDVLVEAMAALPFPWAASCLVVVGAEGSPGSSHGAGLKKQAVALLGDRVRFVGVRRDIGAVMRSLDVLVNASVSEPFGRSVLEAQATGVAVIAAAAGGLPEFVVHEESGLLVPVGEVGR